MVKYGVECPNALPIYEPIIERQMYSYIASGVTLPLKYYLGLQGKLSELDDPDAVSTAELIKSNLKTSASSEETNNSNDDFEQQLDEVEITIDHPGNNVEETSNNDPTSSREEALTVFDGICDILSSFINRNEPHLLTGIVKKCTAG